MAKLIYRLHGVRGREMELYDTKCVITTRKTAGSLLTGNFTDGEKTIFLCDVVGVQFKKSGAMIGYLQLETPSVQMNNKNDNMFSENTFTFEDGKNGVTNGLMREVYDYIVDRIEEIKYGNLHSPKDKNSSSFSAEADGRVEAPTQNIIESSQMAETVVAEPPRAQTIENTQEARMPCPACGEDLAFMGWEENELEEQQVCPICGKEIVFMKN